MKKFFSMKSFFLVAALICVVSVGLVFAQETTVGNNGAKEDLAASELANLPTTKAEKIQYFQDKRAAFIDKGNTAAAAYCTKVLKGL